MVQEVNFFRGTTRFDVTAIVQISSTSITVAGLGPLGNRLLLLRWDGSKLLREIDPSIPKGFPAEVVLRDIQLVYWPAEAVRQALPQSWDLRLSQGSRTFLNHGEESIAVRYLDESPKGVIEFENKAAGYKLIIHTLESSHD